ncbi:chemotaxis protein CheF2 [Halodesulfurarchaeum formicicum]|uniref:Taxis protein CheF n=1 Tax=Halodesulfurarchaeum formicicum TaxID=1873524 RepID=A0A1D8S5C1_9EURY|nr:CheF family chemotaxis protein [Halodesulfurarchaeum formicicum]AOW80551.1 chemotaxis protein CheF2 [Halodesulfurarchaeum formicicum]APE95890.1 chemotaxis protein CheF2 [Halodesulfurarchaeum formicicum]
MGDSVVADFVTDVVPDTGRYDEPVRGRVVMNREEVVLVTPEDRVNFGVGDVFDIAYGSAPSELRAFFEDTVTVAYERAGSKRAALIEGADETVERFTTLLFKAVLNDTVVAVKHPAKVGGRITDEAYERASLFVDSATVQFRGEDPFEIEVSTVSHFERIEREVGGRTRPVLSVRHADGGEIATSEIALQPERKMNVLGRFLRIEYTQLKKDLAEIDLRDEEIEILVGLYSGASEGNLAGMLGVDASRVSTMLRRLAEKSLLEEAASGWTLTPTGKLAVGENLEQVNL